MEGNFDKVVLKISASSGLEKEEIERRIDAKRAKLSGLISKEGAAQIIAAELGISFENEKLKLNELLPGMRKVHTSGKVIQIFPVREFTRNGQVNKVANFIIADDTSNVKVVLWDTHQIELIESGKIAKDSVVEILNASARDGEVHLGSYSELKLSDETFENLKTEKVVNEKKIADFNLGNNVKTRAFIVQAFEPRAFVVCPECSKKVTPEGDVFKCAEHGQVIPSKRFLLNVVLDDGTETIRSVLFHENIAKLGFANLENVEEHLAEKLKLLGKEFTFMGNVRKNNYFNTNEFIINDVEDINLDELINCLEK